MKNRVVESVDQEIAQAKAEAFARSAQQLTAALAELASFDAAGTVNVEERERLLRSAADRVFNIVVQREAGGLRDPGFIFDFYAVPAEVVARVGIVSPPRAWRARFGQH